MECYQFSILSSNPFHRFDARNGRLNSGLKGPLRSDASPLDPKNGYGAFFFSIKKNLYWGLLREAQPPPKAAGAEGAPELREGFRVKLGCGHARIE